MLLQCLGAGGLPLLPAGGGAGGVTCCKVSPAGRFLGLPTSAAAAPPEPALSSQTLPCSRAPARFPAPAVPPPTSPDPGHPWGQQGPSQQGAGKPHRYQSVPIEGTRELPPSFGWLFFAITRCKILAIFKFYLKAISLFFKGRMSERCDLYTFINFHEMSAIFYIKSQSILTHREKRRVIFLYPLSEDARTSVPILKGRRGNEGACEQGPCYRTDNKAASSPERCAVSSE